MLDWTSGKQQRVSFSSIGAEILAAALSADRAGLLAERLQHLFNLWPTLPLVLTVDSKGLFSNLSTTHEGSDYRLRPTVQRIRNSYESREIRTIQWIPGSLNLADGLTKRNTVAYKRLNEVIRSGAVDVEDFAKCHRVSFTD